MIRPGGGGEHDAGGIAFRHDPDGFSRSLPRRPRAALPYGPAALMFLDARARGAALVSMDRTDMDLPLRFCPDATVALVAPDAG